MQKPIESLDDFLNSIEPKETTPPPIVSLSPTGEYQVLKPLPLDSARNVDGLLLRHGAPRISWFHRSLIFGGGAVAAVGLIFLSAVFVAISEAPERAASVDLDSPAYSVDGETADDDAAGPMLGTIASAAATVESLAIGELRILTAAVRTRRVIKRVSRPVRIPQPRSLRIRQAIKFVPTTLVIYAENGEIKSRIEPNLTASYKLPESFSN